MTVGDLTCEGSGPNKKLAKRAAAEQMLHLLGYYKPLPAPGKPALKRLNQPVEQSDQPQTEHVPQVWQIYNENRTWYKKG